MGLMALGGIGRSELRMVGGARRIRRRIVDLFMVNGKIWDVGGIYVLFHPFSSSRNSSSFLRSAKKRRYGCWVNSLVINNILMHLS